MDTIKTRAEIGEDRHLRIDVEVPLPPGPVEVTLVVSAELKSEAPRIDRDTARQQFLAAAGHGASGDPRSSRRVDEVLYGKRG